MQLNIFTLCEAGWHMKLNISTLCGADWHMTQHLHICKAGRHIKLSISTPCEAGWHMKLNISVPGARFFFSSIPKYDQSLVGLKCPTPSGVHSHKVMSQRFLQQSHWSLKVPISQVSWGANYAVLAAYRYGSRGEQKLHQLVGSCDFRTLWGANATCQPFPFLSYREKGKRQPSSGTRASVDASETHGPCSGPPVAKSLVYGPGLGSSCGDRASSPTQFNTYSRGSTHLRVARPGLGFFLSFGSLKPGRWDLGPRLVGTQDSGLGK